MTQPSNGFWFRFFWIPYRAGGHSGPPIFHGRTEVYILNELHQQDKADYVRDIRWEAIRYDPSIQGGVAYAHRFVGLMRKLVLALGVGSLLKG